MLPDDRLNVLRTRLAGRKAPQAIPSDSNDIQRENIRFDVPPITPVMKSFNRLGPQYEVFDPVQKMVEEGAKPTMEAMGGLSTVRSLFQAADEKIPARQDPSEAAMSGFGRAFGRTTPARFLGMADEPARAFEATRQTFLGELARSLSQERGVLTNQDIKRVESSLPTEDDSIYTRSEKLKFIESLIREKIERYNRISRLLGKRGQRTMEV